MTKKCYDCNLDLPLDCFYIQNGRYKTPCKKCRIAKANKWRSDNPELTAGYRISRKKVLREAVEEIKRRPCVECGKSLPTMCMEFYRNNGTDSISQMVNDKISIRRIKEEIEKSELLCIFCRRTRTREATPLSFKLEKRRSLKDRYDEMIELKNNPCSICKNKYEHWQMDFDHNGAIKIGNISTMLLSSKYDYVKSEISKCRLLCAACHRIASVLPEASDDEILEILRSTSDALLSP